MIKSTARVDQLHNNASCARIGVSDVWVSRGLDQWLTYYARTNGWEFWFNFGDELI